MRRTSRVAVVLALSAFGSMACKDKSAQPAPTVGQAPTLPAVPAPPAPAVPDPCATTKLVAAGETFEGITLHCYGSRTYQTWLMAFNKHTSMLRAGEKLSVPPFEELLTARVPAEWRADVAPVAVAYREFHSVEATVNAGFASHSKPNANTQQHLRNAITQLGAAIVTIKARGARVNQFETAVAQLRDIAEGGGGSPDYATEEVHQRIALGVDALPR